MSRPGETHLSDVHLRATESEPGSEPAAPHCTSTFCFAGTRAGSSSSDSDDVGPSGQTRVDSEGDLCLRRKRRRRSVDSEGRITIRHAGATVLGDVGLQVWRGALLLADYLLAPAMAGKLCDATVLELGAGCGLTSIAAALGGASTVYCTDAHAPSLDNALHNATVNNVGLKGVFLTRLDLEDKRSSYPTPHAFSAREVSGLV